MEDRQLDPTWKEILPPAITAASNLEPDVKDRPQFWQEGQMQEGSAFKFLVFWISLAKWLVALLGTTAAVYIFLSAPAYWEKLHYRLTNWGKAGVSQVAVIGSNNEPIKLADIKKVDSPHLSSASSQSALLLKDLENNSLAIPKINKKTPIVWESSSDEEIMLKNLQKGVVHYKDTALPGEGRGPIFISGHSSYYWWDKGEYKTIFANLDQLENGDEIVLVYGEIVYIYRVFEKITVDPEQTEVLDPVNEPILDLMTCVPIGTNLKRLIIKARQINPTQSLPEIRKTDLVPSSSPTSSGAVAPSESLEFLPW